MEIGYLMVGGGIGGVDVRMVTGVCDPAVVFGELEGVGFSHYERSEVCVGFFGEAERAVSFWSGFGA